MPHHIRCTFCGVTVTSGVRYVHDHMLSIVYHDICHSRVHQLVSRETGRAHILCLHTRLEITQ